MRKHLSKPLGLMAVAAFGILFKVKMRWRATWGAPAVARARV